MKVVKWKLWNKSSWILDLGSWILDLGSWIFDSGSDVNKETTTSTSSQGVLQLFTLLLYHASCIMHHALRFMLQRIPSTLNLKGGRRSDIQTEGIFTLCLAKLLASCKPALVEVFFLLQNYYSSTTFLQQSINHLIVCSNRKWGSM